LLRRFLDRLYLASAVFAALCIAGICVVMLAQAFGRGAGILFRGADDITGWLCAAAAFFALGHTFRHGELVRVGLLLEQLGPRARWAAEAAALTFTACFTAYMLWAIASYVYETWRAHYVTQGLLIIPEWIPQVSLVVGMAIFLTAVLDELVAVLRGQKPAYQLAEEAKRASGDFSESV
jgi:TRAP-type C4-dicarboxylate transport system permease small subunit